MGLSCPRSGPARDCIFRSHWGAFFGMCVARTWGSTRTGSTRQKSTFVERKMVTSSDGWAPWSARSRGRRRRSRGRLPQPSLQALARARRRRWSWGPARDRAARKSLAGRVDADRGARLWSQTFTRAGRWHQGALGGEVVVERVDEDQDRKRDSCRARPDGTGEPELGASRARSLAHVDSPCYGARPARTVSR